MDAPVSSDRSITAAGGRLQSSAARGRHQAVGVARTPSIRQGRHRRPARLCCVCAEPKLVDFHPEDLIGVSATISTPEIRMPVNRLAGIECASPLYGPTYEQYADRSHNRETS